jgi:hypothetical protein
MTPAQILATVRAQIDEVTADFYSDDEIYAYMWQAEIEINNLTKCAEAIDTSTTTEVGTAEYAKPSDCLLIIRLLWDSNRMKKIDFRELENQEGLTYGHTIAQSQPYAYYEYGNNIGLYPTPNAAKTIKFYHIKQPAVITNVSTAFTIPQDFHHLIPDYCLWRMWGKDQEEPRAGFHKNQWEINLSRAVITWANHRRADKLGVVKDSDTYPNTYAGMI